MNQTPEERRAYQRSRTKELKDTDEAKRTPLIRRLQKKEGELDRACNGERDPAKLAALKKEYKEVSAQLRKEIGLI